MKPHTELALLRLLSLRLAGPAHADPLQAVRHLGALQAQDLPGALASVALRCVDGDTAAVVEATARGELVRSWPMRGTLHLVPAADLGWMLSLTGERMIAGAAQRRRNLNITDEVIDIARRSALDALAEGTPLTRRELFAVWEHAGLLGQPQAGGHLLARLCQDASLVLGPIVGSEQLVASYADWITEAHPLDGDAALAELARRYVRSHGPADAAEFARWSSLPVTEARRGIALVRSEFEVYTVQDQEYLMEPGLIDRLAEHRRHARRLLLLPGFDEFMLGYADRGFAIAPAHLDKIVPGNNGMFRATIVKGGRVIGVWTRGGSKARPRLSAEPFDTLSATDQAAAERAFAAMPF